MTKTNTPRDILGHDISDLVEVTVLACGVVKCECKECGSSDLDYRGFQIRHRGWCESAPRVSSVGPVAPAEPTATIQATATPSLADVARDIRRDHGNLAGHDENRIVEAVKYGYLSMADAMNRDF